VCARPRGGVAHEEIVLDLKDDHRPSPRLPPDIEFQGRADLRLRATQRKSPRLVHVNRRLK
jgi:hypothetical protein